MTAFSAQPPALRELSGLLDRAQEDFQASRKYLQEGVSKISGEGLINRITDSHDTLDVWLGEVADGALAATSTAVTDAAAFYERTDQAAAARLDATYPPVYLNDAREHTDYVPIEPPEDTARFGDVAEPQQHLREVKDYNRELDGLPNWWDAFSPMAHIGNVIESVTWLAAQLRWMDRPIDPQAEIVKPWVDASAGVRSAARRVRAARAPVPDSGDQHQLGTATSPGNLTLTRDPDDSVPDQPGQAHRTRQGHAVRAHRQG